MTKPKSATKNATASAVTAPKASPPKAAAKTVRAARIRKPATKAINWPEATQGKHPLAQEILALQNSHTLSVSAVRSLVFHKGADEIQAVADDADCQALFSDIGFNVLEYLPSVTEPMV